MSSSNIPTLTTAEEAMAPWNETPQPWEKADITLCQSLSKDCEIVIQEPLTDDNWLEVLNDNSILLPDQLMQEASKLLGRLYNYAPLSDRHRILNIIKQLEHWTVDEQCCV